MKQNDAQKIIGRESCKQCAAEKAFVLGKDCFLPITSVNGNYNILAIGGEGTGKTRNVILPNLMQMIGSYYIFDPTGELYTETAEMYRKAGYDIWRIGEDGPDAISYDPFLPAPNLNGVQINCFAESLSSAIIKPGHEELDDQLLIQCICEIAKNPDKNTHTFANLYTCLKNKSQSEPEKRDIYNALSNIVNPLIMPAQKKENAVLKNANIFTPVERNVAIYVNGNNPQNVILMKSLLLQLLAVKELRIKPQDNRIVLVFDNFGQTPAIELFVQRLATLRLRKINAIIAARSFEEIREAYQWLEYDLWANCDSCIYTGSFDQETKGFVHGYTYAYCDTRDLAEINHCRNGKYIICYWSHGKENIQREVILANPYTPEPLNSHIG